MALMQGLYEKRGFYYYRPPTARGAPRATAVALKTSNLLEAVEMAHSIRDTDALERSMKDGTLEVILPTYYAAKSEDAKSTRRNRVTVLDGFKDILGNPKVGEIDAVLVAEWRDHLDTKGSTLNGKGALSVASKRGHLLVLKAFLNWAKAHKLVKGDPLERLRRQTVVRVTKVQDFLTEEERETLLAAESPDYVQLILHLGFFAGLRETEMLAFNPSWLWIAKDGKSGKIDVQDTPITFAAEKNGVEKKGVWQPKGRRRRSIPLHPRLLSFIQEYKLREPWMIAPHKPSWPPEGKTSARFSAHKAMGLLCVRAKVRKLNYHILRHSFATHLAMKGVPLVTIAALLGDRISVVEDHYAGYSATKTNPLLGL
jgi:integrase